MKFPYEITEEDDFIPQVGDKIEATNPRSGTVVVGTISQINMNGDAYDSHNALLFSHVNRTYYSYRLLYRKPTVPKVGDIVTWEVAQHLPNGSVFEIMHGNNSSYRVVIVGSQNGGRNRIQRVDTFFSWNSFHPGRRMRIKYINN